MPRLIKPLVRVSTLYAREQRITGMCILPYLALLANTGKCLPNSGSDPQPPEAKRFLQGGDSEVSMYK